MDNFEAQWAVALKKSQQNSNKKIMNQKKAQPLDTQKKQIEEEMLYFKEELKKSIKKNDALKTKGVANKLYKIRARQLQNRLEKLKEKYSSVPIYMIKDLIKNYYSDCYNLMILVNKKLKK